MAAHFLENDPLQGPSPVVSSSQSTPLPRRKRKPPTTRIKQGPSDNYSSSNPSSPSMAQPEFSSLTLNLPKSSEATPTEHVASPTFRVPRVDILREPRLHQTFQYSGTPGGRLKPHRVGFAEYGAVEGHPAFVIGGHGCSRLVGVMFEDIARRHSIRMIWPERPGYGLSEECTAQELSALDWAEVVIQLADHLGIRRFSIIAQSVGTVFAMAICHKYPGRVVGPLFLISPWVSTQAANTFKWSRRLPAPLVTRTVSLAMDVMWMLNKGTNNYGSSPVGEEDSSVLSDPSPRTSEASQPRALANVDLATMTLQEEDELLAELDDGDFDLPTDFPPHRPLRHAVRPRHMSLYFAMNKLRMSEPHTQGQVLDVLVALEKYHNFGFSYSEIKTAVTAVWGDKDGLIPQKAIDVLASGLRDVRFKILDGEGHDLVWKEGVIAWALEGVSKRWRARTQRLTLTLMNRLQATS